MVDIAEYNVFRVVVKAEINTWGQTTFLKGEIVHSIYDGGSLWLARNIMNPNAIPRLLPKSSTRELTEAERNELGGSN